MKNKIFYLIASGFFAGVLFSSFFKVSIEFLALFGIVSFAIIFYLSKKFKLTFLFSLTIIFFFLGIFRFEFAESKFTQNPLNFFEGKNISVLGIVADEPQRKENNLEMRVKIYSVEVGDKIENIKPAYIQIKVPFYNNISYGDEVVVSGKLSKIKNFVTDSGPAFDYVSYLKVFGVAYEIPYPKIKIVSGGHGNLIVSKALAIKEKFTGNIEASLGEPDASLVSGMVISGKKSMDKSLQNDFIKAGIIHIVVLSGYNIAIVVSFLLSIFSFVGRKWRMLIVFLGVVLFVIISGASSPVLRAAIMALVVLMLKLQGRTASALRVLLFTAMLMIIWNPYLLVFDTSFELSFLAVFAVMYVSPIIKTKISFVTEKWKLREIISDTLGTQIFLLPFLVYKMGLVSLVALPVNILVLPLVPYIMLLGFIIGVFGFIFYLTFPFAVLAHLAVQFILFIVNIFVALPFASISISYVSVWTVLFLYTIFLGIILYKNRPALS